MKGLSIFGLAILVILALLAVEFIVLQIGIRDFASVKRVIQEVAILQVINQMEFLKKAQEQALPYSFYKAYDFVGKRGGYFSLANVDSYNCIPYWRVYDQINVPTQTTLLKNITEAASEAFNKYMDEFRGEGGFEIPSYTAEITSIPSPNVFRVKAESSGNLKFSISNLELEEEDRFMDTVPSCLINETRIGKNQFITTDSIKNAIDDAISNITEDCTNRDNELRNKINQKITSLSTTVDDVEVSLSVKNIWVSHSEIEDSSCGYYSCTNSSGTYYCSCGSKCCWNESSVSYCHKYINYKGAANVLITVKNTSMEYLIGNERRNIPLKFRVLDGNLIVTPPTNICSETI